MLGITRFHCAYREAKPVRGDPCGRPLVEERTVTAPQTPIGDPPVGSTPPRRRVIRDLDRIQAAGLAPAPLPPRPARDGDNDGDGHNPADHEARFQRRLGRRDDAGLRASWPCLPAVEAPSQTCVPAPVIRSQGNGDAAAKRWARAQQAARIAQQPSTHRSRSALKGHGNGVVVRAKPGKKSSFSQIPGANPVPTWDRDRLCARLGIPLPLTK